MSPKCNNISKAFRTTGHVQGTLFHLYCILKPALSANPNQHFKKEISMSLSTIISRTAAIGAALALALVLTFSTVTPSQAQPTDTDESITSADRCVRGGYYGGGYYGGHRGGHHGGHHGGYRR